MQKDPVLKIKMSLDDLAHFTFFYLRQNGLWKYSWHQMVMIVLALLSGWVAFIFMLPIQNHWALALIIVAACIFMVLLNGKAKAVENAFKALRRHYEVTSDQQGIVDRETTLQVAPAHLLTSNDYSESRILWTNIRLLDDENYYYLFVSPQTGLVINKVTYAGPELEEFIAAAREKITPSKRTSPVC